MPAHGPRCVSPKRHSTITAPSAWCTSVFSSQKSPATWMYSERVPVDHDPKSGGSAAAVPGTGFTVRNFRQLRRSPSGWQTLFSQAVAARGRRLPSGASTAGSGMRQLRDGLPQAARWTWKSVAEVATTSEAPRRPTNNSGRLARMGHLRQRDVPRGLPAELVFRPANGVGNPDTLAARRFRFVPALCPWFPNLRCKCGREILRGQPHLSRPRSSVPRERSIRTDRLLEWHADGGFGFNHRLRRAQSARREGHGRTLVDQIDAAVSRRCRFENVGRNRVLARLNGSYA